MKNMFGPVDQGFVDIKAMALNAAISGAILALPDACLGDDDGVALWLDSGTGHRPGHNSLTTV